MTVESGNWNGSEKVVLREVYCARIGPYTDNETIRRVSKLLLDRWRSHSVKQRLRDRQPIRQRLQSISLKSRLRNRNNEARQRNKSYMDQMFADQLAARKIFQDALNTRAHIQRNSDILYLTKCI